MGEWIAKKGACVLVALALLLSGVAVGLTAREMKKNILSHNSGEVYVSSDSVLLNLNTATEEELRAFSLIGEYYAHEIVSYREQKGGFDSIEELREVFGIGEKRMRAIEPYVTIK